MYNFLRAYKMHLKFLLVQWEATGRAFKWRNDIILILSYSGLKDDSGS